MKPAESTPSTMRPTDAGSASAQTMHQRAANLLVENEEANRRAEEEILSRAQPTTETKE